MVGPTPAASAVRAAGRTARRAGACSLLAAVVAVLTAAPAAAHGAGGADVSNYASAVTGLAEGPPPAAGATPTPRPAIDGMSWRVLANDALLEVRNTTGHELVVLGYRGEPYLRISPDGVFENRRSPAAYLNADRYGDVSVPLSADPAAEPQWVRVSDGPTYAWHDHRIHWMAATQPPQVKVDPSRDVTVLAWAVPFRLDGEPLSVTGELRWIPGPPAWPWVLGAGVLLAVPVAVASRRGLERGRLLRAAATLLAVIAALDVVHTIDDLLSVPATAAEMATEAGRVGVFVAVAAFGAWRGARDDGTSLPAVVAGAVALLAGLGLPDLAVLSASQLAGRLPDAMTRLVVAANVAVVVPVAVAALLAWRADVRERADSEPAPTQAARL